jgi:single-stranded DNA-specific DHH superfamily exonuclease
VAGARVRHGRGPAVHARLVRPPSYILRHALTPYSAAHSRLTLIVPDKDADGLCAGMIAWRTLLLLGHAPGALRVHLLAKGANPHAPAERAALGAHAADYALVLDHGSRGGPALVPAREDGTRVRTLLLDHHLADAFPDEALVRPSPSRPYPH